MHIESSSAAHGKGRPEATPAGLRRTTPLWDPRNYGGKKINAAVGIQWQPFPLHVVELDLGVPLYQDLNGPQLEEDYSVVFSWYVEIPTKRSIRHTGAGRPTKSRLGF